jgi:hypothetical protein
MCKGEKLRANQQAIGICSRALMPIRLRCLKSGESSTMVCAARHSAFQRCAALRSSSEEIDSMCKLDTPLDQKGILSSSPMIEQAVGRTRVQLKCELAAFDLFRDFSSAPAHIA